MVETEGRTLIIKAGADAINVGQVEYELGCGAAVPSRRHRLIPVDASVAEAPDVAAFVAGYHAQANPRLDRPVTELRASLDTREIVVRREAAPVGRFIAEVMRGRMGAEVALINAGAIRSNRVIPSGPLSLRDVVALLPFGNTVALLEVDGAGSRGQPGALGRRAAPSGGPIPPDGRDRVCPGCQPPSGQPHPVGVGGRQPAGIRSALSRGRTGLHGPRRRRLLCPGGEPNAGIRRGRAGAHGDRRRCSGAGLGRPGRPVSHRGRIRPGRRAPSKALAPRRNRGASP